MVCIKCGRPVSQHPLQTQIGPSNEKAICLLSREQVYESVLREVWEVSKQDAAELGELHSGVTAALRSRVEQLEAQSDRDKQSIEATCPVQMKLNARVEQLEAALEWIENEVPNGIALVARALTESAVLREEVKG